MRLALALAIGLMATAPLTGRALSAQTVSLDSIERVLDAGAYWHASKLLAPHLRSDGGSPQARIAAARAAAGWRGWSTVRRMLDGSEWPSGRFDHLGHRLLAEAALADDRTGDAIRHARASLPKTLLPRTDEEAARRWVLLARAHERATAWDSAAAAYTRAAAISPQLGGWLALRAAAVTRNPAARKRLYAGIGIPAARARIDWTEAGALARFDDRAAAAPAYAALGATATSLRLRYEIDPSATGRARIAEELLSLIRRGTPGSEVRQAIEVIAGYSVPVARSESLLVARQASALGQASTANAWYAALSRSGPIGTTDRLAWADAESALGRWGAAAITYRKITSGNQAGRAAYLAARADLRGGKAGAAIAQLNRIPSRFPQDTFAAGTALYLLGDLALDAGRPDSTRTLFRRIVRNYPTSEYAERAALIAPLISYGRGDYASARDELSDAIANKYLVGFAADAGRYWLARSLDALGDRELAAAHYRELISRGPENYYAQRSASRLGVSPWQVSDGGDVTTAELPDAIRRARALEELGLEAEARQELDTFAESASTAGQMIAAGRALLAAGYTARATRLGQRAIGAGAPRDASTWRLIYPLPFEPVLLAASRGNDLDPWLVAALIRQESAFVPTATSPVGARGLMQMMPANGPSLARAIGLADYDHALLWQPDVNLAMGTRHFAEALGRYPDLERALAAYNAGGSRVTRWSQTLLSDNQTLDPELFVERIPYLETRGYVRNIFVNREMYRLVHGS